MAAKDGRKHLETLDATYPHMLVISMPSCKRSIRANALAGCIK